MDQPLTYKSVLPAITVEFQDNSFLDVDDIVGFTLSRTEDNLPLGIAIVDMKFGKRSWHSIRSILINGQPGRLIAFDRFGHPFEQFDDEAEDEDTADEPFDFAKLVIKYELAEEELKEILVRKTYQPDIRFMPEDEGEEDDTEDSSTVLQRSGDVAETD